MTKIVAIAQANLVRTFRDRLGMFFIVVLPMILIVVLGITYGGQGSMRVGVADADSTALSSTLVESIKASDEARIEVRSYGSVAGLQDAVARGFVNFGLSIRSGYEAGLLAGGPAEVEFVAAATTAAGAVRATVERAVAGQDAIVRAARFAAAERGVSLGDALVAATQAGKAATGVSVAVESVAETASDGPSGFSIGAQSQVILFMFLISLTGATELIVSRQLGVTRRMFSTPTGAGTIILGESVGRLAVALFEGGFIVLVSAILFGVTWGDPLATTAIIVVFAFVSAGAAMLIGMLARNASQAGALGPALGMGLGLLGGTMVPAEVFPDMMRTLSHVTPHAWAMDAFRAMSFDGAGLIEILPDIAVLAGFAVLLLTMAGLRFRRLLATGAT
jgi:ABC-2 type transport system permease protein